MALNKFMHPRNFYKNKKPDFQSLALKYPDFRKYVFPDVTGKLFLDFKHPDSMRQLTLTLLKEDFNLDLKLPLNRLIPTVPLRLNYIHWIEDILTASKTEKPVKGIDIGTGSSCIYPLLTCKLHKDWTFIATEVDEQNFEFTQQNIERNSMTDNVRVKKVEKSLDGILSDAIEDESTSYTFCMCNPPFFADHVEAEAVAKSRSYSRSDPKSVCTASFTEKIVEGGEVKFVTNMIRDSVNLKTRVRIYTSMIGKKSSLPPLKEELRKLKVPKYATTEFCQGKTMRWGLAWTFDITVHFPKSLFQESKKEKPPLVYQVPASVPNLVYTVKDISNKIQELLQQLKIHFKITVSQESLVTMSLVAKENTWSHQRRKRRQKTQMDGQKDKNNGEEKHKEEMLCHKTNSFSDKPSTEKSQTDSSEMVDECTEEDVHTEALPDLTVLTSRKRKFSRNSEGENSGQVDDNNEPASKLRHVLPVTESEINNQDNVGSSKIVVNNSETDKASTSTNNPALSTSTKQNCEEEMVNSNSHQKEDSVDDKFLFKCSMKVKKSEQHIVMEMAWVDGENRELMHQVLQYFKNKFAQVTVPT